MTTMVSLYSDIIISEENMAAYNLDENGILQNINRINPGEYR